MYGIEGEQREDLFYHLRTLDETWLDWQAKKTAKEAEARRESLKRHTPKKR